MRQGGREKEERKTSKNNILFLQSREPTSCHPSANKCRKVQIYGNTKNGVKGYNAMYFLMIRRWFRLSLKVFLELLVKISCWSKSAAFLILLLGQT